MRESFEVGVTSAAAALLLIIILLASGMMDTVDLVFPGARSRGTQVMKSDFGEDAIPLRFSYDGQTIYVAARDFPDVEGAYEHGVEEFRLRRILAPMLAWPAPTGEPTVLALVLTNILGIGLAAGALADLASRHGRDARSGYAACVALAFPLVITTTEPLAFGLGLLGLALADRGRLVAAIAALAAAGLGRESALVMALAAGAALLLCRQPWRRSVSVALLPALPLVGWVIWLDRLVPVGDQPVQLLGVLSSPPRAPTDIIAATATVGLMVLAVWRWRDTTILWLTAAGYLGACTVYIGDSFQWEAFVRLSAVGIALGLAGLAPRTSGAVED